MPRYISFSMLIPIGLPIILFIPALYVICDTDWRLSLHSPQCVFHINPNIQIICLRSYTYQLSIVQQPNRVYLVINIDTVNDCFRISSNKTCMHIRYVVWSFLMNHLLVRVLILRDNHLLNIDYLYT